MNGILFMYVCLSVFHICKNAKNVNIVKFHIYVFSLILNIAIAFCIAVSLIASMKTKNLKALMFYNKKKSNDSLNVFHPEKEFSIILFCRCNMRFTHANRHCPDHPLATLRRSDDFVLRPVASNPEQSSDVLRWLERY